jgi:hypothetical protein
MWDILIPGVIEITKYGIGYQQLDLLIPAGRLLAIHLAFVLKCHQKLNNGTKPRIYAKNLG